MYHYTAYHYSFHSAVPLPEFVETAPGIVDIHISTIFQNQHYEINNEIIVAKQLPNGVSFDWDAIGRYEICNGQSIKIFPKENTPEEIQRVPLFGPAMAAVLQQNDLLVLHGSSIEVNGKALIILGKKGHGKSTLTAALVKRKHKLISDDVTALSISGTQLQIRPGLPIIKLWPNTIKEVGFDMAGSRLFYPGMSKRLCPLKDNFCESCLPVGAICVLGYGDLLELRNVQTVERLLYLSSFNYFAHFRTAFRAERHKKVFDQNCQLAKQIEMFELIRPWDLKILGPSCEMIERFFS